jgi:hypothetical protein
MWRSFSSHLLSVFGARTTQNFCGRLGFLACFITSSRASVSEMFSVCILSLSTHGVCQALPLAIIAYGLIGVTTPQNHYNIFLHWLVPVPSKALLNGGVATIARTTDIPTLSWTHTTPTVVSIGRMLDGL